MQVKQNYCRLILQLGPMLSLQKRTTQPSFLTLKMTQTFLILTNKITQISVITRNYALFSPWKVKSDKMARKNELNLLNSFTQGIFFVKLQARLLLEANVCISSTKVQTKNKKVLV